jgi:predicted transcriptional regulator
MNTNEKKPWFTPVWPWVSRLKGLRPIDKVLIILLLDCAREKTYCQPYLKELARDLEVDRQTIIKSLKVLSSRNLIHIEKRKGGGSWYDVTSLKHFKAPVSNNLPVSDDTLVEQYPDEP